MSKPLRILGIAGSLRRQSYNRAALRAATQVALEGATVDIFELDGIPGFSEDNEQNPRREVVELKRRIREADAVLFVTPEYNYSIQVCSRTRLTGRRALTATTRGRRSRQPSWARPSAPSARRARSITCGR